MTLAGLPLAWRLIVDDKGVPVLWHHRWGRRLLYSVAAQPRTCRALLVGLENFIAGAEAHYGPCDSALLAAKYARLQLERYVREAEAAA